MFRIRLSVLCIVLIVGTPVIAVAGEGEHVVSIRPEYVNFHSHGGGLSIGYQWGFSDFINLWFDTGWSYVPSQSIDGEARSAQRLYSTVGAVYHLDSFQWVPYLSTSLGVYSQLLTEGESHVGFGFQLGGGLDYRPERTWSIGIFGMFHAIAAGRLPHHASAGLRVNIYFR